MLEENLLFAQTKVRSRIQELVIPLFIFVVVSFGVLVYGVWQSAQIQNETEIRNSEKFFAAVIREQRKEMRSNVFDVTYWDAAVENLVINLNPAGPMIM